MLPYLRLGPFLLQMTGLALLVGVWLGSWLAEKEALRVKIKTEAINNLIFFGLVGGLVGARLAYAATYVNAYLANPLSLFALNLNTLSPDGGLLIGLLVAFVYGQRKGLRLRPVLDALAPGLAAFMIFQGVAHLLNGDAYGAPTHAPWGIFLWSEYRQPVQVYEILLAAGILFLLLKHPLGEPGYGRYFWLVIGLSAAARVFLEAFRGDSLIWPGGFRAAQVIGLFILVVSLWMIRIWGAEKAKEQEERIETTKA